MNRQGPDDLINASELATFAYCKEAWRLEHGLGYEPSNQKAISRGNIHHARKAVAEGIAGRAILMGKVLLVLAIVTLLMKLIYSR